MTVVCRSVDSLIPGISLFELSANMSQWYIEQMALLINDRFEKKTENQRENTEQKVQSPLLA